MLKLTKIIFFSLLTFSVLGAFFSDKVVFAQSAISCWLTAIGNPGDPAPVLPPECASSSGGETGTGGSIGNGGKWIFPLKSIDEASGIATEMAVYAGTFSYGGHYEHAGLDIGTGPGTWNEKPVFAITDGEVTERASAYCPGEEAGCSVSISHSKDQFISRYTHIDIDTNIQFGARVTKGTLLGTVHKWPCAEYSGNSCIAANDHLHFELRSQSKLDNQSSPVNLNPRNYYPELQRFPISEGYQGNVRAFTANRGYPWANDGREFGNEYLNHPPCLSDPSGCWAH